MKATDLAGAVFGRLTVVRREGSQNNRPAWLCLCTCGATTIVRARNLVSGNTSSCGCFRSDFGTTQGRANATHGMTKSTEYSCWRAMIYRCASPQSKDFHKYGARGIVVCDRWQAFECFYSDMGPRPSPAHTIERLDNHLGYSPENCIWALPIVQGNNKRNNIRLSINGESMTLAEWARHAGISYSVLHGRIRRGWSARKAIGGSAYAV